MAKLLPKGLCQFLLAMSLSIISFSTHAQQALEFHVGNAVFRMIGIEGGTFVMGATPEQDTPYHDEFPSHYVTLSNFYIGQTEVTQALWKEVMGYNPSAHLGDHLPVDRVSWNDCQLFIQRLDSLTGYHFRLPTEAEWEYAARGGQQSRHTLYAGSQNIGQVAWYFNNSGDQPIDSPNWNYQLQMTNHCTTHPVASSQPNELGLYDMSGNVWEWCSDWYVNYQPGDVINPTGPTDGTRRVARGGSWAHIGRYCRVSRRTAYNPTAALNVNGFRLAL